jgi:hypothetical protein
MQSATTTHTKEAVMADKDTHTEVEGHGFRGPKNPETSKDQKQAKRFFRDPEQQVEGHPLRRSANDAEAPDEIEQTDENRDAGEPEVEGHARKFFK